VLAGGISKEAKGRLMLAELIRFVGLFESTDFSVGEEAPAASNGREADKFTLPL
jgi:hypothetical protein